MSRSHAATVAPLVVALATITLAGCTGDPEPTGDAVSDAAVTTGPTGDREDESVLEPDSDADGVDDADRSGDDMEPDDAEGAGGGGSDSGDAACLVGDWVIGGDELGAWYRGFVGDEGIEIGTVTGEILLSMSASEYIYATDGVSVGMTIGGQDATTLLTGGVAGAYSADPGGVMSTRIEESDFDARVTVSGIEFSAQEMGIDLDGAGAFVGYECEGDALTLETQSAGPSTALMTFQAAS